MVITWQRVVPHPLQHLTVYQPLGDGEYWPHVKDMETEAWRGEMTSLRAQASHVCLASGSWEHLVIWPLQG